MDIRARERRVALSAGTNVALRRESLDLAYGKIRHLFSHTLLGINRVFVAVQLYEDLKRTDAVNDFPLLKLTNEIKVYGLPVVDPDRPYILPSNQSPLINLRYPRMINYM